MKIQKSITLAAAIAAVCVAAHTSVAFAASIGLQFWDSAAGANTPTSSQLLPAQVAGVYPQANWNVGTAGQAGFFPNLVYATGAASTVEIDWYADGMWYTGTAFSGSSSGTPDGQLLESHLDATWGGDGLNTTIPPNSSIAAPGNNNQPILFLSGLDTLLANAGGGTYSIILYVQNDAVDSWRGGEFWAQSVTGTSTSFTIVGDLTPHIFTYDVNMFGAGSPPYGYVQCMSTAAAGAAWGNYVRFDGLTNAQVLFRTQCISGGPGTSVNAIQVIARGLQWPPDPAQPTIAPSATVYAGTAVTLTETASSPTNVLSYYWYTFGSTTNFVSGVTTSNLTFTSIDIGSTYTTNFFVVVSNQYGATTSAVASVTINPSSPPFVTQDISVLPFNTVYTSIYAYDGGSLNLYSTFSGVLPIHYNWNSNSVDLVTATNTTLSLANISSSANGSTYVLAATNAFGGTDSSVATLTVLADPPAPTLSQPYAYAVKALNPLGYWRLHETADDAANSVQAYDYSGNNFDGTYGANVGDGVAGPPSSTYPGFESGTTAAYTANNTANCYVSVPANLNVNTNTVTITAWIQPQTAIGASYGLFMWRSTNANGDAAGLCFGGTTVGASTELGYTWNTNRSDTWGYHSGLYPVLGQWSFVAVTITPTHTTLYLDTVGSTTNLLWVAQVITNGPESFNGGVIDISSDNQNGRVFNGAVGEVAIFKQALSVDQVQTLFCKSLGVSGVAPAISTQPVSPSGYQGPPVQFTVIGGGYPDPTYKWQSSPDGATWSDLSNVGRISGANSNVLTYSTETALDVTLYYQAVLHNAYGSVTSSVVNMSGLTPTPQNGQFTVNYSVISYANNNPGNVFSGYGVLGTGSYWNPILNNVGAAGMNDTDSYDTGIRFAVNGGLDTNGVQTYLGNYSYSPLGPIFMLDGYINTTASYGTGTSPLPGEVTNHIILSQVPKGTYNLAFYGTCGAWANRGDFFNVNGVVQNIHNGPTGTDTSFTPGVNTVVYTGVVVGTSGGTLDVQWWADANAANGTPNNTEGDFNGMQIQLVSGSASQNPANITSATISGGNIHISGSSPDAGQTYHIVTSTNLTTPKASWTPVASGTFSLTGFNATIAINPADPEKFYRVVEP